MRRRPARSGFTLLELMVSISILTVIVSIVYVSFNSIVNSSGVAEAAAKDMRLRQFLSRGFSATIPSVRVDEGAQIQSYQLLGENSDGPYGPADTLRFACAQPLLGARSLPGVMKVVTYEVVDRNAGEEEEALTGVEFGEADPDADEPDLLLVYREEPLVVDMLLEEGDGLLESFNAASEAGYAHWSVPVRSVDFAYFDGEEWVEEWDSLAEGLLPWAIRVRVNFQKSEEAHDAEQAAGISALDDPDFEVTLPIPCGAGTAEPFIPLNPAMANLGERDLLKSGP